MYACAYPSDMAASGRGIGVMVYMDAALLDSIDRIRGEESRSAWVRQAIRALLDFGSAAEPDPTPADPDRRPAP